MLTIRAFLIRLRLKSAVYFSLIVGIVVGIATHSIFNAIAYTAISAIVLFFVGYVLTEIGKRSDYSKNPCLICGSEHLILLYPSRRRKQSSKPASEKGSFACSSFDHAHYPDILYCPECKNGFTRDVLETPVDVLKNQSHEEYSAVVDTAYIENLPSRLNTYEHILAKHKKYFEGKNVLEIGCYYGAFHEASRGKLKSYTGLEPSRHACENLKQRFPDANVINGPVEILSTKTELFGTFDTVVLFDVIEHLPRPIETLRILNKMLKPGGIVIFSTINIEATFAQAMGPYWPWYMDMHYYYFSDRGYYTMLYRSGFVQKEHRHFPYWVSSKYFVTKVSSILGISSQGLVNAMRAVTPQFDIPMQLGDVVLIVGKKVED